MWSLNQLVILAAIVYAVGSSPVPSSTLTANGDANECKLLVPSLFCDYSNVQHETVTVKQFRDSGIKKVFLHGINTLHLSDSLCIDVAVNTVKDVIITDEGRSDCPMKGILSAKKSNLRKIPTNITGIFLEDSKVDALVANAVFSTLSIVRSDIAEFTMTHPLDNIRDAVIQDSTILSVHDLTIGSGTNLVIQKAKLSFKDNHGIRIQNATLTIKDPSQTAVIGKLILGISGILKVDNEIGGITVQPEPHNTMMSISEENPAESKSNNTYIVPFFVCFALLVVSLAAMAAWEFYGREAWQNRSTDEVKSKTNENRTEEGESLVQHHTDSKCENRNEIQNSSNEIPQNQEENKKDDNDVTKNKSQTHSVSRNTGKVNSENYNHINPDEKLKTDDGSEMKDERNVTNIYLNQTTKSGLGNTDPGGPDEETGQSGSDGSMQVSPENNINSLGKGNQMESENMTEGKSFESNNSQPKLKDNAQTNDSSQHGTGSRGNINPELSSQSPSIHHNTSGKHERGGDEFYAVNDFPVGGTMTNSQHGQPTKTDQEATIAKTVATSPEQCHNSNEKLDSNSASIQKNYASEDTHPHTSPKDTAHSYTEKEDTTLDNSKEIGATPFKAKIKPVAPTPPPRNNPSANGSGSGLTDDGKSHHKSKGFHKKVKGMGKATKKLLTGKHGGANISNS